MKISKLEKYKLGNFSINDKHIYAEKKLRNIKNLLLKKHRLSMIGGSSKYVYTTPPPDTDTPPSSEKYKSYSKLGEYTSTPRDDVEKLLHTNLTNKLTNRYNRQQDFIEKTNKYSDKANNDFLDNSDLEKVINLIKTKMTATGELLVKQEDDIFKELMDVDKNLVNEFNEYRNLSSAKYTGLAKTDLVKKELLRIQKSLFDLQVKIIFSKLRKIKKADITPLLDVIASKVEKMNAYMAEQERIFDEDDGEGDSKGKGKSKSDEIIINGRESSGRYDDDNDNGDGDGIVDEGDSNDVNNVGNNNLIISSDGNQVKLTEKEVNNIFSNFYSNNGIVEKDASLNETILTPEQKNYFTNNTKIGNIFKDVISENDDLKETVKINQLDFIQDDIVYKITPKLTDS